MGGLRLLRLVVLALLVGAGTLCATTASAQTTAYNGGSPSFIALTVNVSASVGSQCGFVTGSVPSGTPNYANFDTAGFDQSFTFKLSCTSASRVGVVSTNGGLLTSGSVPSGYAVKAPYDVQLSLVGNSTNVTATCTAADLVAAGTTCAATYLATVGPNFTGPASTTKGLQLTGPATNGSNSTIRVKANAYAGSSVLMAGTYNDTLTVTVSPST